MNGIKNSQFLWTVIAALIVFTLWGALQIASAHNIGWKWDTSDDPMVSNIDTPYSDEIESGADDYDDNTDLSVDHCVRPCSESIQHIRQYVGSADWAAAADSYSNGQQCNVDITCNETTNKVTSGVASGTRLTGPTQKATPTTSPAMRWGISSAWPMPHATPGETTARGPTTA